MKESASPFGNQAEIIQEGPAIIPEQYARGLIQASASRTYRNTCGSLKPDQEPCFKASMPSFSWNLSERFQHGFQGRNKQYTAMSEPGQWIRVKAVSIPAGKSLKFFFVLLF
ncbi:MAG: hypothetical protein HY881_22835 [Deltaproteobacteria bacterium]|nr:hypothetical protein [Deltaproteobacteria bacterium]